MKALKKLLVIAATVIMFCVISVAVSAETYGDLTYTVSDGEVTIISCSYSATEIKIPSKINGYPVTTIGDVAFSDCDSLTSVIFPNSLKTIGDKAFYDCISLTNVTIPNSVTSIGDDAFHNCESLTSITIPNSVTIIGDNAFCNCKNLTNITIPDSVTIIGDNAFYNTAYYKNSTNWENDVLYINNHLINTKANITGNYEIKQGTITISNFAFSGCHYLKSVTIPDSVTRIGTGVFSSCYALKNVTIPDTVKTIGEKAFYWCDSLKSVIIGKNVVTIKDYAFSGCSNLTRITIPNSVTTIGDKAFYDCKNLTSIIINNPKCLIYDSKHTINNEAVIYGYCGSTAQKFTEKYEREFETIGHKETIIPIYTSTCTRTGLTAGKKCSVCDKITVAQQKIPLLAHTYGEWKVVKTPTVRTEGKEERACSFCGKKETKAIAKLNFILGDVNGDNQITAEDARLALRLSAGLETLEKLNVSVDVVDYNKDKQITAEDARRILRKSAGLE